MRDNFQNFRSTLPPLRHVIIGRPLREGPHIRTLSLGVGGGVRNPIHSENQPETFLFKTPSPSGGGGGPNVGHSPKGPSNNHATNSNLKIGVDPPRPV